MSYKIFNSPLDEAEKPFWISYSDLMTALMILFLVVMVASLASISQQAIQIKENMALIKKSHSFEKPINNVVKANPTATEIKASVLTEEKAKEIERFKDIKKTCESLKLNFANQKIPVNLDCVKNTIELGEGGRFDVGSYALTDTTKDTLNKMVEQILLIARSELGKKWLKRIHVSGYTDYDGSYLYNLNLSLKRSEWVICQIVNPSSSAYHMTDQDRALVKRLFLVSGVSYNDQLQSKEASRRVEFKLEFRNFNESTYQPHDVVQTSTESISPVNDICPI